MDVYSSSWAGHNKMLMWNWVNGEVKDKRKDENNVCERDSWNSRENVPDCYRPLFEKGFDFSRVDHENYFIALGWLWECFRAKHEVSSDHIDHIGSYAEETAKNFKEF